MDIVKRIDGEKVNLRIVTKADALAIYQQIADEDIARFTHIPYPYELEDAYEFIKLTHSQRRKKTGYHFGLEDRNNSRVIGGIHLDNISEVHGKAEIGYWLAKPFWGQGIMVEAIRMMLRFSFTEVKLHRVQAYVLPENEGSIRVLEKTGFTREGFIREGFKQRGKYIDVYLYSMLEDDWGRLCLQSESGRAD